MRKTEVRVASSHFNPTDKTATVTLADLAHRHLDIVLVFKQDWDESLELVSVHLDWKNREQEWEAWPGISASDLRAGFPWASWADAARNRASEDISRWEDDQRNVIWDDPANVRNAFLGQVATDYRRNLALGVRDPAAKIARDMSANPATVRTWIRRARQLGLLGPAKGPTPGELSPDETPPPRAPERRTSELHNIGK